jgi:hypothetical protein
MVAMPWFKNLLSYQQLHNISELREICSLAGQFPQIAAEGRGLEHRKHLLAQFFPIGEKIFSRFENPAFALFDVAHGRNGFLIWYFDWKRQAFAQFNLLVEQANGIG